MTQQYYGPNCPICNGSPPADAGPEWESGRKAHHLGHVIDWVAGDKGDGTSSGISLDDIEDEIRYIFNDLNNPELNKARQSDSSMSPEYSPLYRGFGPERWGCFSAEARAELMAEAIRAYLVDPNYIKTVAPNVARRIRDAVNPNPALCQTIQFN